MDTVKLFLRFKEYCNSLSKNDRIAILHHADCDGLCSAVITAHAVEKLSGKPPVLFIPFRYNGLAPQEFRKLLESKRISKLFSVDLGLDNFPEFLKEAEKVCPIALMDHHKIYNNLNSNKTIFLKTRFFSKKEPSSYACSKFCYDMFSKILDVSEKNWIACIGILGDMGFKAWKPFFAKTLLQRKITRENLDKAVELIEAVETVKQKDFLKLLKEFQKAKSLKEILSSNFMKYSVQLKKDLEYYLKDFEKNSEKFPELGLFIYEIEPMHDIKSAVINRLSLKYPKKTILLIQKKNEKANFSARRQDFKVKMNELLENAIKGIPESSAGGHIPAAAGRIPVQCIQQFKENILAYLKSNHA